MILSRGQYYLYDFILSCGGNCNGCTMSGADIPWQIKLGTSIARFAHNCKNDSYKVCSDPAWVYEWSYDARYWHQQLFLSSSKLLQVFITYFFNHYWQSIRDTCEYWPGAGLESKSLSIRSWRLARSLDTLSAFRYALCENDKLLAAVSFPT